ncbi:MAG: hypothetical protein PUF50_03560 [Erysipelotrichaceae bacterium]|nr:hypothetical protein [Erysipelotrichaceae bacterium]
MANVNVWGTSIKNDQTKNTNGRLKTNVGVSNDFMNAANSMKAPDLYGGAKPYNGLAADYSLSANTPAKQLGTGRGSGYGYNSSSLYAKQMELIQRASQMSLANQANQLRNSLASLLNSYQTQQDNLNNQLQTDMNQNEVERYKAQRALRETLANRGALDSGVGRQDSLNMSNAYSNRLNSIKNTYNSNSNSLRNNANNSISELDNLYQNALSDVNSNILSQQAEYTGKGFNSKKDYTIRDDSWSKYLADLKKQYGL